MVERTSEAVWRGSLKEGTGEMTIGRGAWRGPFTFASRFESGAGTNPEELIAAAHAGCFSMQLSGLLTAAGHPPKSVATVARVRLDTGAGGAAIAAIELETEAEVPGIDEPAFRSAAEKAKEICPVSKALRAVPVTLRARLRG